MLNKKKKVAKDIVAIMKEESGNLQKRLTAMMMKGEKPPDTVGEDFIRLLEERVEAYLEKEDL